MRHPWPIGGCCARKKINLAIMGPKLIYEKYNGVSKIIRTDAVKIITLTTKCV
jgi:hypothetical protein